MSCKSDVRYNYGRASEHDDLVYGAARPGAEGQRCYNPEDKVTEAEVREWGEYMAQHGVRRVVSLLTPSEVATYDKPPAAVLAEAGGAGAQGALKVAQVDVKAPGAADALEAELRAAEAAGEKVVVHCWGGGGRTGLVLAAWLVRRYGLSPEDAAAQVESYSKAQGASRRADVAAVKQLLGL